MILLFLFLHLCTVFICRLLFSEATGNVKERLPYGVVPIHKRLVDMGKIQGSYEDGQLR